MFLTLTVSKPTNAEPTR